MYFFLIRQYVNLIRSLKHCPRYCIRTPSIYWSFKHFQCNLQILFKKKKLAGSRYIYSMGSIQIFCTTDVDLVKEINQCTSLSLGKPSYLSKDRGPLLGQGILASSGPLWVYQRKVIAPELYLERVKVQKKYLDNE